MFTEKQIKGYAKALRKALSIRNLELSHAQSLELLAETLGEKSWNHLSAKLDKTPNEQRDNDIPQGWSFIGREHLDCYSVQLDNTQPTNELIIQCVENRPNVFASLMQFVDAKTYLDFHVKLTAEVATIESGPASLWIRVDGKPRSTLAFDNMVDVPPYRALEGTNDWTQLELVLDVPSGADIVNFGLMLSGKGTAKFRNINFEKVEKNIPISGGRPYGGDDPQNLGFN